MQTRLKNVKRGVVALATLGLVSTGLMIAPSAQAVTPGPNGSQIAVVAADDLWLVNADGSGIPDNVWDDCPGSVTDPSWSPDNVRLAVNCAGDVWIVDVRSETGVMLANQPLGADPDPSWSPDGTRIAIAGIDGIYSVAAPALGAGGSNSSTMVQVTSGATDESPTYSPDGSRIAFTREVSGDDQIFTVAAEGGLPFQPVFQQTDNGGDKEDPSWGFGSGNNSRILYTNTLGTDFLEWVSPHFTTPFLNENVQFVFETLASAGHAEYSPDSTRIVASDGGGNVCAVGDQDDGGNSFLLNDFFGNGCDDPTWRGASVVSNPPLAATPNPVLFSAGPGQTDIETITISNTAGVPKTIEEWDIETPQQFGTPVFQFVQPGTTCGEVRNGPSGNNTRLGDTVTLPAFGSCTVRVLFTAPFNGGAFEGQIQIDDPLLVTLLANQAAPSGELDVSKSKIDFGKVKKGKTARKTIVVENEGNAPVVLDIDVDGQYFSLSSSTTCDDGEALDAGDDCKIVVKYNPKAKGTHTGVLTVNGIEVDLKGKGK